MIECSYALNLNAQGSFHGVCVFAVEVLTSTAIQRYTM